MAATLQSVNSGSTHRRGNTDKLCAEITELCACIHAATYRLLVLIREFDEREGWHQPGEQGALIVKALQKALDDQCAHHDDVSAETPDAESGREPISARRADALAEVAESYLNGNETTATTADRYQVVVHVSAETSRRIGCDCSTVSVMESRQGEPLSIGRKTRSIPSAIRRALRFRDEGCRFPGCTKTRFVDGHHIHHWADGRA